MIIMWQHYLLVNSYIFNKPLNKLVIGRVWAVPMELTGQLDPSKKWEVRVKYGDQEKVVLVSEDTSMLELGEKEFDGVDSSCRNGVCATCAGQV